MKRTLLTLVAVSLVAGACATSSSGPGSGGSGIQGTVLLGPTCPVETIEHPCPDRPLVANVVVSSTDGTKVAGVRSGDDGRFSVAVPPGEYVITVAQLNGLKFAKPISVTVPDGRFVQVTVSVDSGIR